MKLTHDRLLKAVSIGLRILFMLFVGSIGQAQTTYPNKPVRVILPFLGGGALDQMARIVADNLTTRVGQNFYIDVKAGAGGVIGADFVAKSNPDGYTLLFSVQAPLTAAQFLNKQIPYDGLNAFVPISIVTEAPNVLIVWPGVPFRNVADFLAVARSAPNKLSYATQGQGTTGHITAATIELVTGAKLLHVPYKGFPPMLTDLETGRVDMMFADSINAIPRIKSKELIAIAVAADKRIAAIPDVPTFSESGLQNITSGPMFGLYAPAETPRDVVNRLYAEIQIILKSPSVIKTLKDLGVEIRGYSPDESIKVLKAELSRTREAVKSTGIQAN